MQDFYTKVYEIVEQIPFGRVTTYGAIAKALGTKKSSRMVGVAMNYSHELRPELPAHRVVNRMGLLTGRHHFSAERSMEELLTSEGIVIKDNQVLNFDRSFWDPLA